MHILHVSSDFIGTKVHENLFRNLASLGLAQMVYCPVRDSNLIGKNRFEAPNVEIVYDNAVKPFHKYAYHVKRHAIFNSLQKKVDLSHVDLCHASTLFTDGGQAYKIYKKYHIPYVVAVRNTDINGFLNVRPETWLTGRKILLNAKRIFFISKALMDRFCGHRLIFPLLPEIENKMLLIPNGIDDYYLDHVNHEIHSGHRVLYVGDFSNNKNVKRLCEAVLQLSGEENLKDVQLTLVGGGKAQNNDIQDLIDANSERFHFLGPIYDKAKLCEVFNQHSIFAMPSIYETFGLVYLEALSQNLPVLYTKGQGIDGLFDESVGIGVNPLSVQSIKDALRMLIEKKNVYSNHNVNFEDFRWCNIAQVYESIYQDIV